MAEVQEAQGNLLQSKWGPLPVWTWALIALGAAWAWAKYRANKTASAATSTASTATNASEGEAVAPQFIIEEGGTSTTVNNQEAAEPPPSAPVTAPVGPPPPVATPPGTSPSPPIRSGGKPPARPAPVKSPSKKKQPIAYRVQHGDTLDSIAQRFHVPGGGDALFAYNTTPGNRPAKTIATLKARGKNLIYANEEIDIPQ